jgi:hypothetical protein
MRNSRFPKSQIFYSEDGALDYCFYDVIPLSLVDHYPSFVETCCLRVFTLKREAGRYSERLVTIQETALRHISEVSKLQ